ncbi:hypothetical protein F5141DRAFT_1147036 [Pisolithus sp. B1]|nr:hypothetical protein F5141DRAFT_1147036 [Pisolithus sp. B1]
MGGRKVNVNSGRCTIKTAPIRTMQKRYEVQSMRSLRNVEENHEATSMFAMPSHHQQDTYSLDPHFQSHSTHEMNFVSADMMLCRYLTLTLRHQSMVDAGPLYYSMGYYSVGNAILKYMGRGFRYIRDDTMMRCLNDMTSQLSQTYLENAGSAAPWIAEDAGGGGGGTRCEQERAFWVPELK